MVNFIIREYSPLTISTFVLWIFPLGILRGKIFFPIERGRSLERTRQGKHTEGEAVGFQALGFPAGWGCAFGTGRGEGGWLFLSSGLGFCTCSSFQQPCLTNPIWLRSRNSISRSWRKQKRKRKILCLQKKQLNKRSKLANRNEASAANMHCTFHEHCLLILLLLAV